MTILVVAGQRVKPNITFKPFNPPEANPNPSANKKKKKSSKRSQIAPVDANVRILTTCSATRGMGDPGNGRPCIPLVTHADGRPVSGPISNLFKGTGVAKPGEELVMYAVGLGKTTPAVKTGQPTPTSAPSVGGLAWCLTIYRTRVRKTQGLHSPSAVPAFAGLTPGFVGLYQINFVVPPPPPGTLPCLSLDGRVTSNLTVSIGAGLSFDGANICVDTEATP